MKVSPITGASIHRNAFLSWCSVYCFPVWVLLIYSELSWLLSFRQIKAKWFSLMFYFLCFWPDIHAYDTFYILGLLPVLSILLLLHPNLSPQNQAPWSCYQGTPFALSTEDLKSQCPTKGGWCSSLSLMLSVPWWHICRGKNTFDLFLRSLVSLRLWVCTVLCASVLLPFLYDRLPYTLSLLFALRKLRVTFLYTSFKG